MKKGWMLCHLREGQEELTQTIAKLEAVENVDEVDFEIAMAHMHHHLNTVWNSRALIAEPIEFCSPRHPWRTCDFLREMIGGPLRHHWRP